MVETLIMKAADEMHGMSVALVSPMKRGSPCSCFMSSAKPKGENVGIYSVKPKEGEGEEPAISLGCIHAVPFVSQYPTSGSLSVHEVNPFYL